MRRQIVLAAPALCGNEWAYLKECLDTNWVSSIGPFVTRFERTVAAYIGRRHAIAAVNGTAALHVALLVAGVAPDDEVIMPTLTFIAPANAARYAGAWPLFVDVEPDYWQLDIAKLADFLSRECAWVQGGLRNRTTGRRVRAVLPVNVLGHPADLQPIIELARSRELVVIEDATESLGSRYRGEPAGRLSDIACLSFNGNKIVTTGGGGMIVTDNASWAGRARYLTTQAKDDAIEYVHHEVGYNYRLSNIQAALGVAQIEQLDRFVEERRTTAGRYRAAFDGVAGLSFMREAPWAQHNWWLSTTLVDKDAFGCGSRELIAALGRASIEARPLWQPLHRSPAHAASQAYRCEVADRLYAEAVSLPSSVGLSVGDQQYVIDAVLRAGRTGSE